MMSLSYRPAFSLLAASGLVLLTVCGAGAQQAQFSTAHRNAERTLPQSVTGGTAKLRSQLASGRAATSLVVADFDEDGTSDLVSGYAVGAGGALLLQRGNPHAIAPTEAELRLAATGQPVQPFAAKSEAIGIPVHPDLLQTTDIGGHGHSDILVAANGDTTVYLLRGDGKGNFASPQALSLGGAVSSLATWRGPEGANFIAAGVCGATGCGVQLLDREGAVKAFVPTAGSVTGMEVANLNNGRYIDIAAMTADNVVVLDGASLVSGSPQSVSLPVSGAASVTTGAFVYDLRGFGQIAVLGSDATLHVFARAGVDSSTPSPANRRLHKSLAAGRPSAASLAWTEAETVYNVGPGGTSAVMVRGRFSGGGYDDLAVMAGSQYVTVAHPLTSEGTQRKTNPVVTTDSTSSTVKAAVAARISPDARLGIITAGGFQPNFTIPGSSRTMTVNSTTDALPTATTMNACKNATAGCTLRAAIAVANADTTTNGTSHVDTINLPAGTYTITSNNGAAGGTDVNGSFDQHFNVDGSVNFVGAGTATTIINANHLDKVFQLNSGVTTSGGAVNPLDIFFSNLTIENGENKNNPNAAGSACANNGLCDYFGGNMDYDSDGPGTLGFTNVTMTGGKIDFGDEGGGGLFVSNQFGQASAPGGLTEFDTSTISSNTAPFAGGAIAMGDFSPLTLNSDTITGNSATHVVSAPGEGGGLWVQSNSNDTAVAATAISITNSTFSSNSADEGGAIYTVTSSPTISGSTFTGNTAGAFGGAIYVASTDRTAAISITTSNFTTNAVTGTFAVSGSPFATNGAAICTEGASSAANAVNLNIHFSRFHGNTGGHATAIGVGCESNSVAEHTVTVNATDNWWGCNGAAAGTGCDTVLSTFSSGPTITLSPFTTLTLSLSSTSPTGGSSLTATSSLGQDSTPTAYSLANDAAYDGVPAALSITQHDGTLNTSSAALSGLAATALTTTVTAAGNGTATVTVDGFSVSTGFTVIAPTDLTVTSTHSGNFKAGDSADTYTLTATNSGGTSTSGTVTVVDTLPSGFTATAMSGTNWSCTVGTLTCTSTQAVAGGSSFPVITLTVSVSSANAGTYTNSVHVGGGGEVNTGNDTGTDSTIVVGQPTISESFSPTSVATGVNSTVTFTLGNPSANVVSLTGVAFSDTLPANLKVSTPNGVVSTCGGTVSATAGGSSIGFTNGTLTSGQTCTVKVNVNSTVANTYTNTTGAVTATNSNAGGTASATLTVVASETKLVYTAPPAPSITVGGNAGTVTVAIEDGSNNVATSDSTTLVTLTVTGPSSYLQTYTATAASGVATFNLTAVALNTAGSYTYTASSGSLTSAVANETVGAANQTITFTGLPATATFGSAGPYTLNGTASSGLPVSYTVTGPASLSGTTLTITGAGTVSVTASQAGNANFNAATPVTQTIVVGKTDQTITFTLPSTATFGSAGPYTLNATASSGLPVSYNLTGPATLSGNTLTIIGAGLVQVFADQAGNANFNAAPEVAQIIDVREANQTITFTGLPASAIFGSAGPYPLNGTASSGLSVSYTVSGPATLSGNTLTITGIGTVSVTANQAGNANFNAATPVTQTINIVGKTDQTITFTLPSTATFGSAGPYTLNATASSGLPVSYNFTGPATLSGNTLTIIGAGLVQVFANQAGNANFNAAPEVAQIIDVREANQTITFTGLPASAIFGSAGPYPLNGTASSGLSVSYTVSGPATLSGNTLTITGAGTVSVTASQAGNANFNAATPVTQTIVVSASSQTITFTGLPATATFGSAGPYTLNGAASSGLPVSYTVSGPASLSGTTLTITGIGTVSVTASQAGNANFNAATPVTQTIVVSASSQTITFTGLPTTAMFGSAGPYTLNATASSGLPVSYSVSGPAILNGTTLTITGVGTVSVTASQAGNANFGAATPVTQTIVVSPGNQTITFTGLPTTATFGSAGPYTLNGTASSGLPVSYTVSGPASISGTTLTITGAGTVSVTASQAGNNNFNPATPVTQTIVVAKANQTINFTGLPASVAAGAPVSFTLNGTASSGLPVSYTVSGPATLSGTTLTINAASAGTVSVTASQAGNANYNAATPVTQTIVIGTVQLATSAVLSFNGATYQAVVTVTNNGTVAAQNIQLTVAMLGAASATSLPASFGTIANGGSASVTLTFPLSAGAHGAPVLEKLTGTYTGGTFGGSFRATLP
jgi:trimeric autotransporter adhesin